MLGAVLGGVAGGLLGAGGGVLGGWAASLDEPDPARQDAILINSGVFGAIVGGGVGALIGGIVGSLSGAERAGPSSVWAPDAE